MVENAVGKFISYHTLSRPETTRESRDLESEYYGAVTGVPCE